MVKPVYEWKLPNLYPVSAQVAGETIEGLKTALGKENIEPKELLDASRPADAPLHNCFEWDDAVAAEKYRLKTAGDIIRNISVEIISVGKEPETARAFVNVSNSPRAKGTFVSIKSAMENEEYRQNILHNALVELRAFQRRYCVYRELANVSSAIDDFAEKLKAAENE